MTILDKSEFLASFPDNTGGDIIAENMRDFVYSSKTLLIATVTVNSVVIINSVDAIIAESGANNISIPAIAVFKNRPLRILNRSGGNITINPNGSETISGLSSLVMANNRSVILLSESSKTDWLIFADSEEFFTALVDTPSSFSGDAGQTLAVNSGETAVEFVNPATQTAVFFEETNTNLTTITDLVTFEDLNISLASSGIDTLSGFSVSGNTITKTSSGTGLFYLTWMTDGEPDTGASRAYTLKMFKNGSTGIPGASKLSVTANLPETAGVLAILSLTQNDTVDLKVRADTNIVDFLSINNCISFRRAD